MSHSLTHAVETSIIDLARRCGIEKLILFGSRAKGTNRERSDIDLAVQGGNTMEFSARVDDEIQTLLMFDVVDLDKPVQAELLEEIRRDGIVLYEKI